MLLSLLVSAAVPVILAPPALAGSVTLTWTAPGDDSLVGRAARFDLRYSTQMITPANFSLAVAAVNPPVPGPAGSIQSATVAGLVSSRTYYFAIKSGDDNGNWSAMSNVVSRQPIDAAAVDEPLALSFSAPRPNPARQATRFDLVLPGSLWVRIEVFDIGGRMVRRLLDGPRGAGTEDLVFDLRDDRGTPLAQGVYVVRARLGESAILQRLVVTR